MFVEQLWCAGAGTPLDLAQAMPFGLVFLVSALVLAPTLLRRPGYPAATDSPRPALR